MIEQPLSPHPAPPPRRASGWSVAAPILLASGVGAATLWLAPPVIDRIAAAWLFAAAAGIAAAALSAVILARNSLRMREWEWRRQQVETAWRTDADQDDSLEDEEATTAESVSPPADLCAVIDMIDAPLLLLDPDGWVLAASPAATSLLAAAAAPESLWNDRTVWPAPLVPEQRRLPSGCTVIIARDAAWERLRTAQLASMDATAELAGAIVHDVNNALGAIAGYADFLVADLPANSPQADYALRILRATERKKTLLRRILMGSLVAKPDFRPTDGARVLADAATRLRSILPPAVALSVRDEPDLPPLLGDGAQLARSLAAAGNDLFHLTKPDDGHFGDVPQETPVHIGLSLRVTLWTGRTETGLAPAGWRVHQLLTPRPSQHLMFELRSAASLRSDTALLAALAPLLAARNHARAEDTEPPAAALTAARRHEGGLIAWTHPTEGIVLRLFIPAVAEQSTVAVPAVAPARATDRTARCHVLVVDDQREVGDRLSIGLEKAGCEVAVCESAAEALEIVVDEPDFFDVVVVGPMAVSMTGAALIARLKALRPDLSCVLCGDAIPPGDTVADLLLPEPLDIGALSRAAVAFAATRRRVAPGPAQ